MSRDDFQRELRAQLARAQDRRELYVDINAGELHRRVGGYPGDKAVPADNALAGDRL